MSPRFHKWLKAILTLAMVSAPFAEESAFATNKCTQQIIDACKDAASSTLGATGGTMASTGNTQQNVSDASAGLTNGAKALELQAGQCANTAKKCQDCKKQGATDDDIKQCQDGVIQQATTMNQNGQQMKKSGSDMSGIAGMMTGVAGAALGYMMAKQQQQQQQQQPPPQPVAYGALQLNGTLNCQMADSYQYADCASYLMQVCLPSAQAAAALTAQTTPATGTIISSPGGVAAQPNCAAFNETYCSSTATPPQPNGYQRMDGVVTQVNLAGTGQGLGTPYCANTVATAWCSDAMYGASRAMCPSCLQINTSTSLACAQNPSLCLAQNTGAQSAELSATCAGDPLYTAGSPYSSGAGVLVTSGAPTTGVPTVMLPQNATLGNSGNKGGTSSTPGTSGTAPVGLPSTSLASASTAQLNGAARETASVPSSSAGGSQLKALSMEQIMAVAHSKGPNELFGAGGVVIANGSSFVSRGPASDVASAYGPSLFTTSTAVIRHHCQEGRLNNCK